MAGVGCPCVARFTCRGAGDVTAMRRYRLVHALAQRLWVIPSLGLAAGIVLSLVTVAVDRRNEKLRLLAGGVARGLDDEDDRRAALVADQQGIGSGADVATG